LGVIYFFQVRVVLSSNVLTNPLAGNLRGRETRPIGVFIIRQERRIRMNKRILVGIGALLLITIAFGGGRTVSAAPIPVETATPAPTAAPAPAPTCTAANSQEPDLLYNTPTYDVYTVPTPGCYVLRGNFVEIPGGQPGVWFDFADDHNAFVRVLDQ